MRQHDDLSRALSRGGMWGLRQEIYSTEIFRNSLKLLRILPVPSTKLHNGSSAMHTGSPVSSRIRLSRCFSKAPPPARTMPRSLMSAESSGGVRSSAARMALTMVETHSLNASRISLSSTVTVLGMPSMRPRPLISIVSGLSSAYAEPILILICSAVRSPISRLYSGPFLGADQGRDRDQQRHGTKGNGWLAQNPCCNRPPSA